MSDSRAIIYCRVSSPQQAAPDKSSLENQLDQCHGYAADHALPVVKTFVDAGVTGMVWDRPQVNAALAYIKQNRIGNVIFPPNDRHGRGMGAGEITRLLFEHEGAIVHVVGVGPVNDPKSRTAMTIKEFVSGIEHGLITERTNAGRIGAARKGRLPAGRAPYGYRRGADGKLTRYEPEADIVNRIFQSYVDGLSMVAIAAQLTSEKIPTPFPDRHSKRIVTAWIPSTTDRILHARTYRGEWLYRSGTDGDLVVPCPPIVSDELWNAAQAARVRHAKSAPKQETRLFAIRRAGALRGDRFEDLI